MKCKTQKKKTYQILFYEKIKTDFKGQGQSNTCGTEAEL